VATAQAFCDITAVPTMFLFDKSGKTANVIYGASSDLHQQAEKVLDGLTSSLNHIIRVTIPPRISCVPLRNNVENIQCAVTDAMIIPVSAFAMSSFTFVFLRVLCG